MLRVAEGLDLVLISDDEVLIQFGLRSQPSELLRDHDVSGLLGRTIGHILRGPATYSDLLAQARPGQENDARTLIEDLIERGVLAEVNTSPVDQYLRYTFSGQPQLTNSRIAILGAGPLGARITHSLTQHGLGTLTVLDDRPVDDTWRSYAPFGLNDKPDGMRADVALCATPGSLMRAADGALDVAGIEALVVQSDLVVLALEQPDLRIANLLNRFAVRERRPWLLATIDGNHGMVGPLFLPVETACYTDYRTLAFAATPNRGMARKFREHLLEHRGSGTFFAGLPAYVEIVAGHATLAAVHFLLRGTCFALSRVMVIDFERMQIDLEDVLKLPRCPVCGVEKNAYRPALGAAT